MVVLYGNGCCGDVKLQYCMVVVVVEMLDGSNGQSSVFILFSICRVSTDNSRSEYSVVRKSPAYKNAFLYQDRISHSKYNRYTLPFSRNNENFLHLKIVRQLDGQFILGQFSKPFMDIPKVINHYSQNKLNIRGAEHKYLKHPVYTQPEYHTIEPEEDDGIDL